MASSVAQSHTKGQFFDERNLNQELGTVLSEERAVNWENFLKKMKESTPKVIEQISRKVLDVHPEREAFQLFGVLTAEECAYFIAETEAIGYQTLAGYSHEYRSNTRRIIHYEALRDVLWERIQSFLTPSLPHKSLDARWRMYGLNPQFRFCRYEPGQKFAAHYDGNFMVSSENKSFYTFMIYLNGGFDGGATNFLSDSATPPRGRVLESLAPEPGMLLVFQHNIFHEGEELRSGLKYMMRSDVMYKLDTLDNEQQTLQSRSIQEAQELIGLAEQYESQGKFTEAIAMYKKAYKLAPELEHNEKLDNSEGPADSKQAQSSSSS